jgi:penicillin-binding protein 2
MRLKNLSNIVLATFAILVAGLFWTQVIRGGYYYHLSENNRIRVVPDEAQRGRFLDFKGKPLADSALSYDLVIRPQDIKSKTQRTMVFERLSQVLGMSVARQEAVYKKNYLAPFADVPIAKNISKDLAFRLEQMNLDLPQVFVRAKPARRYACGEANVSVLGYLGEIDKQQLDDLREYGYRPQDIVGKSGLEKALDMVLRGTDGGMQIEVNNKGRQVGVLSVKKSQSGTDVRLTIDADLQECAYNLLKNRRGAVIVLDPNDGRVLSMVSSPGFNPQIFFTDETRHQVEALLSDASAPFLNRTASGQYPAGSIFKIVTATAGLQTKRVREGTTFYCPGFYSLGRRRFNCWKETGHGVLDLKGGLQHSCNVYFFKAGQKTGQDAISYYARVFGLGRKTGIRLLPEVSGFIPDKNWKRNIMAENWYEGDTVNLAIGQGYVLITPLQAAVMVSAIANNGRIVQPHIVESIGSVKAAKPRPRTMAVLPDNIQIIKDAMAMVVQSQGGTGILAAVSGLEVSGKTGTAQVVDNPPHAWFVGYAPSDKPKAAIAVFLENGGYGGEAAAPIAGAMFKKMKELEML